MRIHFFSQTDVERLLPMDECIDVMADALRALSRGDVRLPLRSMVWLPDRSGLLGLMPGWLGSPLSWGLKVVSVMPGNHGTPYDSHQGVVILFETAHGSPVAIMDGSAVTAIRTAAASGAATRALARPEAGDLAILGSGVQAGTHLDAMRAARPVRRVRVWSRSLENARAFAARESARHGLRVEAVPTARDAVAGADLVCTTTAASDPVLLGDWLAPGAHVNAVGACFPNAREMDGAAVARSRFFVDCRESAANEAGDYLLAKSEGAIGEDHIVGEVGEVLLGRVTGRVTATDVTVFKSLGIAIEDLAAADHVYRKGRETGAGTSLELSGAPHPG